MSFDDDKVDMHRAIGKTVAFLAAVPGWLAVVLLGGLVLYKYWGWFVLPAFPGVPTPTILHFVGLKLFLGVATIKVSAPKKKTESEKEEAKSREAGVWEQLAFSLWMYGCMLLVGWLTHMLISIDWHWANNTLGM